VAGRDTLDDPKMAKNEMSPNPRNYNILYSLDGVMSSKMGQLWQGGIPLTTLKWPKMKMSPNLRSYDTV
jgi:hypothetical protein